MADQEGSETGDGFTFVDKRRVAEDAGEAVSPAADAPVEASTDTSVTGEPSVDSAPAADDISEADLEEYMSGMPDLSATSELAKDVVSLLTMNAFQQLGLIPGANGGAPRKDLPQARLAIDCVSALVGALDSSSSPLDANTRGEYRRVLTDLRLNYVNQSRAEGRS